MNTPLFIAKGRLGPILAIVHATDPTSPTRKQEDPAESPAREEGKPDASPTRKQEDPIVPPAPGSVETPTPPQPGAMPLDREKE